MKTTSKIILAVLGCMVVCALVLPVVLFRSGDERVKPVIEYSKEEMTVQFDSIDRIVVDIDPALNCYLHVDEGTTLFDTPLMLEVKEDSTVTGVEVVMDKVWADNVTLSHDVPSTLTLYVDMHTIYPETEDGSEYPYKSVNIKANNQKIGTIKVQPGLLTKGISLPTKPVEMFLTNMHNGLTLEGNKVKDLSVKVVDSHLPLLTMRVDEVDFSLFGNSIIDRLVCNNADINIVESESDCNIETLDYNQI